MDFFKSVFSERTPSPSPPTTPTHQNSQTTPPATSPWAFGSTLLTTIATKSESLLDNYYKDLQEFSSGLKKETSVIRQAASRAVQDLPARLESGAAIAQESLEAVGQAIDNVGSTVTEIMSKDLNFSSNDSFFNTHLDDHGKDLSFSENVKPYSRVEAMIRGVQCNLRTYCDEVEEDGYTEWRMGFRIEERREEIEQLFEDNRVIKEIYDELVPVKIDEDTFWCRYFYRVDKVVKAEEARARFVKRAISGEEEEELSWDVDDDDDNDNNDEDKSKDELKKDVKDKGKGVENSHIGSVEIYNEDEPSVSGTKSGVIVNEENLEGSEGKLGSDISIISSQRSSHVEDDLGWDEIEDIVSVNESNLGDQGNTNPNNGIDLRKRLSVSEEDEELTWDIEDDDEPVKS